MECPECAGSLAAYVLDGREASVCERCGWVGIETDHRGEGVPPESWDDALDRFYERHVTTERRSRLPPVAAASGRPRTPDDEGASAEAVDGADEGETVEAADGPDDPAADGTPAGDGAAGGSAEPGDAVGDGGDDASAATDRGDGAEPADGTDE